MPAADGKAGIAMYFGNRWVPMEVMNTILLLWAIAALIIGIIFFRLYCIDRSARSKKELLSKTASVKRKKKRRR